MLNTTARTNSVNTILYTFTSPSRVNKNIICVRIILLHIEGKTFTRFFYKRKKKENRRMENVRAYIVTVVYIISGKSEQCTI